MSQRKNKKVYYHLPGLFSRMESFFKITRITPMEITAAGMEADTVIPTLSPK